MFGPIEQLRRAPTPQPLIGDRLERWLPPRIVDVLRAHGRRIVERSFYHLPSRDAT